MHRLKILRSKPALLHTLFCCLTFPWLFSLELKNILFGIIIIFVSTSHNKKIEPIKLRMAA